jgi:CBS domain-containing protein
MVGAIARFRILDLGSPMQTVAEMLESKPDRTVHTITPTNTVFEAMTLMAEKNIGALVVMAGQQIVGIVTERDYANKMAFKAEASRKTPVRDIMTASVICVRPDQTSEDGMMLMGKNRMRHLPVVENGKLIGMISIRDLVDDIIANL